MSVLIPCAPANYPHKLEKFIQNLAETATNFQDIEICVCIDGPEMKWEHNNVKYVQYPPTEYKSRFFEAAYRISTAPWILLANDDMTFLTKGWDTRFDFTDPWRLYHFNDSQFRNTFACHPLTSRKVWELLDEHKLVFPNFVNMGCDTTIWDVMPPSKRFYYDNIFIQHDRQVDEKKIKEMEKDYEYYYTFEPQRREVNRKIADYCNLGENVKVLIGLSTGEFIRKANFLPWFLGIDKPAGSLMTTVHGQSPAQARNIIIQQALDNNCTHVLFLDDDMEFPPDTLMKLLGHNVDGVMGLYLMRTYPHFPVAFDRAFPNGFNKFMYLSPEVTGLVPITNGGLGCVLIKTEVFKKMQKPWVTLGEIDKEGWCDDVSFFNRYREAGFKLYLDTNLRVGHMTTITLYPDYINDRWMTNYKHINGNVLVPQVIPTDEDTEKESEKYNTPLPTAGQDGPNSDNQREGVMAFNPVRDIWANLRQLANNDVWEISDAGAPTSGTSGTGANFAGPGSWYTNITTGDKYVNTGTKASPTWSAVATGGFDPQAGIVASGFTTSVTTTQQAIAISGALTTDVALVTWRNAPGTTGHIIAVPTTTGITVTYITAPGTAGTIQYALVRAL